MREFATSFVTVLGVELLVRAGLHWSQQGRFDALLKTGDVLQALIVAGLLAIFNARTPGRRR